MQDFRSLITRNQMAVFVLLAYLISWAMAFTPGGGLIPHGPMIAAFIVLAITVGRQGVSELWKQMTRWRVDWKWYLVAPGIFVAIQLFALAVSLALGVRISNTDHLQSLPVYLGMILPLVLLGGLWEEPGWTGYALKRFQERYERSPLVASFFTGLIRMVWHTPLLLSGAIPWHDFLFYSFGLQFVLAWLYNRSNKSVLIAMIGHLFSNVMHATMINLIGEADRGLYWTMEVVGILLIALGLLIATRAGLGVRTLGKSTSAISAES
jgi:hypothetical protein